MIFPSLEKLYKEEGEAGRTKFNQYARIAAVPMAALQAVMAMPLMVRLNSRMHKIFAMHFLPQFKKTVISVNRLPLSVKTYPLRRLLVIFLMQRLLPQKRPAPPH